MDVTITEGVPGVADARVVIVASRFNTRVTHALVDGALQELRNQGVYPANVEVVRVPGAFELAAAVRWVIESRQPDAVLALGAVIRGETPHFDYVSSACFQGLTQVSVDYDVPLGLGVLTTDTGEQALARAGGARGNKGADAALAALEMLSLRRQLAR